MVNDLHVLAWTGAAGDQSPHLISVKKPKNACGTCEVSIALKNLPPHRGAWKEALEGAEKDKHKDVPMSHVVEDLELLVRNVLERMETGSEKSADLSKQKGKQTLLYCTGGVIKRYENQLAGTVEPYRMELHVIRLGDIAIATNPFRAVHGLRDPDESSQPCSANVRHPVGRPGTICRRPAQLRVAATVRSPKVTNRPRRRKSAGRTNARTNQLALACGRALANLPAIRTVIAARRDERPRDSE